MTEPFLDLGDVGVIAEGVGRGRRAQRMRADLDSQQGRVMLDQLIDAVGSNGFFPIAPSVVPERPEQGAVCFVSMSRRVEIVIDKVGGKLVKSNIPFLVALALNKEVRNTLDLKPIILDPQLTEFAAAEAVIEKGCQNGAIAFAFEGSFLGCVQQSTRLAIGDSRRPAGVAYDGRSLNTLARIVQNGVAITQVVVERRKRGQPVPNGDLAELFSVSRNAFNQIIAPSDHMSACDQAELLGAIDAGKRYEILDRLPVSPLRVSIVEVPEPLDFGRHIGQMLKLQRREELVGAL